MFLEASARIELIRLEVGSPGSSEEFSGSKVGDLILDKCLVFWIELPVLTTGIR
jgi:hypothetical protein